MYSSTCDSGVPAVIQVDVLWPQLARCRVPSPWNPPGPCKITFPTVHILWWTQIGIRFIAGGIERFVHTAPPNAPGPPGPEKHKAGLVHGDSAALIAIETSYYRLRGKVASRLSMFSSLQGSLVFANVVMFATAAGPQTVVQPKQVYALTKWCMVLEKDIPAAWWSSWDAAASRGERRVFRELIHSHVFMHLDQLPLPAAEP